MKKMKDVKMNPWLNRLTSKTTEKGIKIQKRW